MLPSPTRKGRADISYIWTREGWRPPRASDQWRHHGEPGSDPGPAFPPRDRLGSQQPDEARSGIRALRMAIALRAPPKASSSTATEAVNIVRVRHWVRIL